MLAASNIYKEREKYKYTKTTQCCINSRKNSPIWSPPIFQKSLARLMRFISTAQINKCLAGFFISPLHGRFDFFFFNLFDFPTIQKIWKILVDLQVIDILQQFSTHCQHFNTHNILHRVSLPWECIQTLHLHQLHHIHFLFFKNQHLW